MKITISDQTSNLYSDIIDLLADIKLALGPSGLDATLRKHKSILRFIKDYELARLQKYEKAIAELEK